MFKTYYWLTKPGIVYGNAIATVAGFLLAAHGAIDFVRMLTTVAGICLVMASACVFNNWVDRDIDKHMTRTKKRALVTGSVSPVNAVVYATCLGLLGFSILAIFTNMLAVLIAAIGFIFYVILYAIGKRKSVYGTLVGSVSGAVPPVVGYVAVSNQFDGAAFLLFIIMTIWQMPHFYAIAIYRLKDYQAANLPVLPVVKGTHITKVQILIYIIAYVLIAPLLGLFGFAGITYIIVITLIGLVWLRLGIVGFRTKDSDTWARAMFRFSLVVLLVFCLMISIDWLLP